MSLENLTRILTSDYKIDLGELRRAYLSNMIYLDGKLLRNSCDTFCYPVMNVDTGHAHTVKINRRVFKISKRTDWKYETGDSF
jgi:hypothetical protein